MNVYICCTDFIIIRHWNLTVLNNMRWNCHVISRMKDDCISYNAKWFSQCLNVAEVLSTKLYSEAAAPFEINFKFDLFWWIVL